MVMSFEIVKLKNKQKKILSPEQKKFNKLRKKLEKLKTEEQQKIRELDQCLQFYHSNIFPEEELFSEALIERVNITYEIFKTKSWFSPSEKLVLKALIVNDIQTIFNFSKKEKVPLEIFNFYKELTGKDYNKEAEDQFGEIKADLEKTFKKFGVDVDLSKIKSTDPDEEMMSKFFESVFKNGNEDIFLKLQNGENQNLEKPNKEQLMEEIQDKNLSKIYKQLVKIVHPDLESDPEKKKEKEDLMKKLTVAYEKNDLATLLELEMKYISDPLKIKSDSQLKIYNEILEDQIEEYKYRIDDLLFSPNYFVIQHFFKSKFTGIKTLHYEYFMMHKERLELQILIKNLKTSKAKDIIKEVIYEYNELF